jgi:Zn-dependent peptidase ImmA (M78 family)
MPRATEVPITPDVLVWAISESGFSDEELAEEVRVSREVLLSWKHGTARPTLTQMRRVAAKVHRQLATFLLPAPPDRPAPYVEFRDIAGRTRRELLPIERRYLRRAYRMQQMLAWIEGELGKDRPRLRQFSLSEEPDSVAKEWRRLLSITEQEQEKWPSASRAFDGWRAAVERLGLAVFLFPLTARGCRGFSLWNDRVPVVAVNTAWREEARIFTLLHECGHLVTGSNSACAEWAGRATRPVDPVERWCERFAAAVLLPAESVVRLLTSLSLRKPIVDLGAVRTIANRFKVSLRAAALRLIELRWADRSLYDELPPTTDSKPPGGGGSGRNRLAMREDELGLRGTALFVEAVREDVISRSQAVEYLDIPDPAFDELAQAMR